jgi:acyl carrier protein
VGGDGKLMPGARAVLTEAWCELLGLESADPEDDFFLLGGHSLLAVELAERVEEQLGFELPLEVLFGDARLGTLLAVCEELAGAEM